MTVHKMGRDVTTHVMEFFQITPAQEELQLLLLSAFLFAEIVKSSRLKLVMTAFETLEDVIVIAMELQ